MDMDDRFANGAYIADAAAYPPRWDAAAAAFRDATLCELDVPYGPSPRQVMDIFYPNRMAKGLVVFVHGGYWRMFDKSSWSHLAAGAVARGPIRLTGHSAGGQLVARLAGMDWDGRLEKVVLISPVADLVPLMDTKMQNDFQLTKAEATAESPIYAPAPATSVTIWVGADERLVFIEQAQALGAAWGCPVVLDAGKHHFDVIDGLAAADSPLCQVLFS